jgi:hypothetical protein
VAKTAAKRLLCCGFRRTGKFMGQEYQCYWRICREMNVLCRFEYHICYVLYPFLTYILTLPRNLNIPAEKFLKLKPVREELTGSYMKVLL